MATIYQKLSPYILTETQLYTNDFPRTNPNITGRAIIGRSREPAASSSSRKCCRCNTTFIPSPHGQYTDRDSCVYHYAGYAYWKRSYPCCGKGELSTGCRKVPTHVFKRNDNENLCDYVTTSTNIGGQRDDSNIYSVDCEMVYTTAGRDIAKVSVVDCRLRVVYESYIKPDHQIIDYNTIFSGITEADLRNVNTTLRDVHTVLKTLFNENTILVGHSLDSDLTALKIIHNRVVDTSVVFPHKRGPPYKRALRNLVRDHLHNSIQDDMGHSSSEDAKACMELMLRKIRMA